MAISHTLSIIRSVVGVTGNVISFFMFTSPLPTFLKIYKKKSVEQFKADPYLATIMNCSLWVLYGLPLVHPNSILVLTTNAIGLGIELAYISIYFFYADRKRRVNVMMWLTIEAVFLLVLGGCTLGLLHTTDKRSKVVGILSVVFCLGMYVAPLTIMHKVMKTKSVKYMPFWLSLGNFGNGLIWTIYAFIPVDYFIMIPNGLGTIAGVAQLVLYAYYRKSTPEEEEEEGKKPAEMQMSSSKNGVHTTVQV